MLEHALTQIHQYFQAHPYLAGVLTCLVAFAESLPLIGTIIPGSITMSILGILAGRGLIPIPEALGLATFGAFAGDIVGFALGKSYKQKLHTIWPFRKHPRWLTLSVAFFERHGGKSILIGRFVGPARSSIPLIAGLLHMSWLRFLIAALSTAFLWALAYLLPGFLIGALSLEVPPKIATKFMLFGLAVVVSLWLIFWSIQRFFAFITAYIHRNIKKLWRWLNLHHSSRFIMQWITNPKKPHDSQQLLFGLLIITFLLLFFVLAIYISLKGSASIRLNSSIFYFLQSIRTATLDHFFVGFTLLGTLGVVTTVTLTLCLGFSLKGLWRIVIHSFLLLLVAGGSVYFLKHWVHSTRPPGLATHSFSFPSGHVGLALPIFGWIAFLAKEQLPKKWHWLVYTLFTLFIITLAFSRLYLGAHWLTDILGSGLWGFSLLLIFIISYRRRVQPYRATWVEWAWLGFSILLPWAGFASKEIPKDLLFYKQTFNRQKIIFQEWWNHPERYLPIYRLDRFGHPAQPFNIQWAAPLPTIKQTLSSNGWLVVPHTRNVKSTLIRFTSYNPEKHLPVFSLLYRHRPPVLLMIKHIPNNSTIIELRLWKSGLSFSDNNLPLWIGTINYHHAPKKLLSLKHRGITLQNSGGLNTVLQDSHHYERKVIAHATTKLPRVIQELHWNGDILLIRTQPAISVPILISYYF